MNEHHEFPTAAEDHQYWEGRKAAKKGLPVTANPIREGGEGYFHWIQGWFYKTGKKRRRDRADSLSGDPKWDTAYREYLKEMSSD